MLPLGLRLQVAELHTPLTSSQAWRTIIHGQIYAIGGYDHERELWAGYVGMSSATAPGRAWDSYTRWTRAEQGFVPHCVALITEGNAVGDDELRVIESRVIRELSGRGLYLYNTHASAKESSRRLGEGAFDIAAVGDHLAAVIAADVFNGATNPLTTPAHTLRESAVRVVLAADRALTTWEVIGRLRDMGVRYGGTTPDRTVRRDLSVREIDTAGIPRVMTGYRHGRCLYWSHRLPAEVALARYDACRPRHRQRLQAAANAR